MLCAAFAAGPPIPDAAPPAASGAPGATRVHQPGEQMERALTDTVLACLRDDAAAAFAGMERLEAACRRLSYEDVPPPSRGVLTYDQALHTALDRSKELLRTKHVTEAFDQFVWVMRACRQCHEMARRDATTPAPAPAPAPAH